MNENPEKTKTRERSFVEFIIQGCQPDKNKAMGAALRRADNPATEYQSWEYLAQFGVDIDKEWLRLPYATIAANIAKAKPVGNGNTGIGRAIAMCYTDGKESVQAKARLRRLLACESVEEVCRILRPLLTLIASKAEAHIDYAKLLEQLLEFHWDDSRQWIKDQWAQDFYGRNEKEKTAEVTA